MLRKAGRIGWGAVLDLTRDLYFPLARDARAAMRRRYTEDRWLGQKYFPVFVVEKDTLEPVCEPMAAGWQMPFASSRGYSSLTLQHDVAELLRERKARFGQWGVVLFLSDLDPSGLDLQRAWEDALRDFGAPVVEFVRVGLTLDQIEAPEDPEHPELAIPEALRAGIGVKASNSRSRKFLRDYPGGRCWEADILPAAAIEAAIEAEIYGWLDIELWNRRDAEIRAARAPEAPARSGRARAGSR